MTLTKSRVLQYVALITLFAIGGGVYWYFSVRAAVTLNKSGVSGTAKVSTSQNASLTNGLVGEWSFDGADISGTTAYDRSGQGNNGTLVNSPTKTQGRVGQGLGTNPTIDGYMNAGSAASLDDITTRTVTAWIKPTTSGENNYGRIADKTQWLFYTCDNSFIGCSSTNNKLAFAQNFSTTNATWRTVNNITLGTWQHVAVTYDASSSSNDPIFYINGVPAGTYEYQAPVGTFLTDAADSLCVGNSSTSTRSFDGTLDEVRVYNRVLSASEIQSLYALGDPEKVNSSVSTPQGAGRLDSGLAGYWTLDDGSGTNATDASTNGNTGTLTNGPTWATGQIGGAATFDGSNDYITIPDTNVVEFNYDKDFSLAVWTKIPSTQNDTSAVDNDIVSKWNNSGGYPYALRVYNQTYGTAADRGKVRIARYDGTNNPTATSTKTINDDAWHHIVATKAGSVLTIYVDGMANATATDTTTTTTTNATAVELGRRASATNYFTGSLDEFRLYNRALSADEVSRLYALSTPTGVDTSLKGYWSFNGQDVSGTTAYDRSGAGNTGTLSGAGAAIGKLGQALTFDGSNDYVSVSDASSLDITGTLTLSAWVRKATHPAAGNYEIVAGKGTVGSAQHNYVFGLYGNGSNTEYLVFRFYNSGWHIIRGTTTSLDLDTWYHIVAVYDDAANAVDLYVNGVTQSETVISGDPENTSLVTNNQNFWIGDIDNTAYSPFDGRIDDVRIYNRAFTSADVTALYNQGR